jgi:hypothetical protein
MKKRSLTLVLGFAVAALVGRAADLNIEAVVAQAKADPSQAAALVSKAAAENPSVAVALVTETIKALPSKVVSIVCDTCKLMPKMSSELVRAALDQYPDRSAEIITGITDCVPTEVKEAIALPPPAGGVAPARRAIPLPQPIDPSQIVSPSR